MKNIVLVLLIVPSFLYAQDEGIHFDQKLSWKLICDSSKRENLYIFLDCYATWCQPCREMDKDVYTSKLVGDYFKGRFISVKVQLDSSKTDSQYQKEWYKDAREIARSNKISSLPTFLFFSPEGTLVHKGIGYMGVHEFLDLCSQALDPQRQYYTLLDGEEHGKINYQIIPYIVKKAKSFKDTSIEHKYSNIYVEGYLATLDTSKLFVTENIEFLKAATKSSTDFGFSFFYKRGPEIDKIMKQKGYAQGIVDGVISLEDVYPKLWKDKDTRFALSAKPEWKIIENVIQRKYDGVTAARIVLDAKITWYGIEKDWNDYGECVIRKVERYGPYGLFDSSTRYNEIAWDLFNHCSNKYVLTKALEWADSSIRQADEVNAEKFDTYANILYKLGRKQKALVWERKALATGPTLKDIQQNYDKMKNNLPTWPTGN